VRLLAIVFLLPGADFSWIGFAVGVVVSHTTNLVESETFLCLPKAVGLACITYTLSQFIFNMRAADVDQVQTERHPCRAEDLSKVVSPTPAGPLF
jgi:hypothetical protein